MIAEVHRASGVSVDNDENAKGIMDEAAQAPGTEQLLVLVDPSTREGYSIHLWRDRAAYEAFAERRQQLTAKAEESGGKADPGRLYEVTYRS